MWGFENYGVIPDIVTLGKPMGAGHPLAAVVTTAAIAEEFAKTDIYFNTFGGNPVSAMVGNAVLDVIEKEQLQQQVRTVSQYLRPQLEALAEKYPLIGNVRGLGMFLGVELVKDRASRQPAREQALEVAERMRAEGVLMGATGRYGNVLKIRPPLVFSIENADFLLERLDQVMAEVTAV